MMLKLDELAVIADNIDNELFGKKINDALFNHINEEIIELKDKLVIYKEKNDTENKFEALKELGDVLFCILSIAKQNELDASHALSLTITKLQERIKYGIKDK